LTANASSEIWLCLSGGNALGAYHEGAYRVLHAAGIRPKRVAGTSVGAIVGALIAGNRPEDRLARLDEFWQLAASDVAIANFAHFWDGSKIASSLGTLLHGRPGLFQPSLGLWWRRLSGLPSPSLFERSGMRKTLTRLVDFDYLNGGDVRLVVNATDVSTGEEQVYDTSQMEVTMDHLMASSAFPVLFPSEPLGERHMVDGGLVANLPILPLFREPPAGPVRCLAFDLVQANGPVPNTLDEAGHRMQDLLLSNQSKRSMELLKHRSSGWPVPISLLHIAYKGEREVGGKMLEFSAASMKVRADAGKSDAEIAMQWLGEAGLSRSHADHIQEYEFGLTC